MGCSPSPFYAGSVFRHVAMASDLMLASHEMQRIEIAFLPDGHKDVLAFFLYHVGHCCFAFERRWMETVMSQTLVAAALNSHQSPNPLQPKRTQKWGFQKLGTPFWLSP